MCGPNELVIHKGDVYIGTGGETQNIWYGNTLDWNIVKLEFEANKVDELHVAYSPDAEHWHEVVLATPSPQQLINVCAKWMRFQIKCNTPQTVRFSVIVIKELLPPVPPEPPVVPLEEGILAGETDSLEGAYSLRLLSSLYEGTAIRLELTSGVNQGEQYDPPFVSGYVDTASITTWLDGETAQVNIFYDQSGNGRNLIFGDGAEPLWNDTTKSISFTSSTHRLEAAFPDAGTSATMFAVGSIYNPNGMLVEWGEDGTVLSGLSIGNADARKYGSIGTNSSGYWRDKTINTWTVVFDSGNIVSKYAGTTLVNEAAANGYTQDRLKIGNNATDAYPAAGIESAAHIKELICWTRDASSWESDWRTDAITDFVLGGSPTAVSGAYDSYLTNLVGAFGLRQLRANYTGPLFQLNGFEVYPDNTGFADIAEISASAETEVFTWYDQSTGGYDLTKGTTGPSYTTNASYTINSLPVIRSTSSSTILSNLSFENIVSTNPWAVYCRTRIDGTNDMTMFAWTRNSGSSPYGPWLDRGNPANTVELKYGDGVIQIYSSDTGGDDGMFSSIYDGTNLRLYKAGTQKGYTEAVGATIDETRLFMWTHPGFSGTTGSMAELLLYNNADHTSTRTSIETIMSSKWGIGEDPAGVIDALALSSMKGAWSTRKLYSGYTGDCLRLRKGSGGGATFQAFGFDANGDLDTAAIATWLSGSTGYVQTWYDQSTYGTNLVQNNESMQATYLASDSTMNNKPTLYFSGAQLYTISWTHVSSYAVNVRCYLEEPATNSTNAVLCFAESNPATTSGGGDLYYFDTAGTKTLTWRVGSSANDIDLSPTGDQNKSYHGYCAGSTHGLYVDGSSNSHSTTITDTNTHFHLGQQQFGSFSGSVGECIIWSGTSATGYAQWLSDMGHEYYG